MNSKILDEIEASWDDTHRANLQTLLIETRKDLADLVARSHRDSEVTSEEVTAHDASLEKIFAMIEALDEICTFSDYLLDSRPSPESVSDYLQR